MNLVLDDAEELSLKQKTRKPLGAPRRPRTLRSSPLPPPQHRRRRAAAAAADTTARATPLSTRAPPLAGRILLKGDNITLMMSATAAEASS